MQSNASFVSVMPAMTPDRDDLAGDLDRELTEILETASSEGARLPHYEVVVGTLGETGEVTLWMRVDDPDDVLDDTPAVLESYRVVEEANIQSPRAVLAAVVDDSPQSVGPAEAVQEATQTVCVRCEPAQEGHENGGDACRKQIRPWPDSNGMISHIKSLTRVAAGSELPGLARVHISPVLEDKDSLYWASKPESSDIATDGTAAMSAVGYRPTVSAVVFKPSHEHGASMTRLAGEGLATRLGESFAVREYAARDVETSVSQTGVTIESVTRNQDAQAEIIDELDRMVSGCGAAAQSQPGILSPSEVTDLLRPPAYSDLLEQGIYVSQATTSLRKYSPETWGRLYSNSERGIILGESADTPSAPVGLSRRPRVHGVVSDQEALRVQLLAQQIVQHHQDSDVSIVIDPTGELTTACAATSPDSTTVCQVSPAEHDLSLAPFNTTRLVEAGWSESRATAFILETYRCLLAAAHPDYQFKDSLFNPISIRGRDTEAPALVRTILEAELSAGDGGLAHETLRDLHTADMNQRRRTDTTPRFDGVSQDAATKANAAVQTIDDALPAKVATANSTDGTLIDTFENTIVCIDLSDYQDTEHATTKLLTVLLVRSLFKHLCFERARRDNDDPKVTVAIDTAARLPSYEFAEPLFDLGSVTNPEVTVLAGVRAGEKQYTQPHRSTLYRRLCALTVATTPDSPHYHLSALSGTVIQESLTEREWVVHEQADSPAVGAVLVDEQTAPTDTPLGLRINLPDTIQASESALEIITPKLTPDEQQRPDTENDENIALNAAVAVNDEFKQLTPPVLHRADGAQCPVCDQIYDTPAPARRCHVHRALRELREATPGTGLEQARGHGDDHPLEELQAIFDDALTATGLSDGEFPFWADGVSGLEAALMHLHEHLPANSDTEFDAWAQTFLTAVEFARCGVLPGYQLTESMQPLREQCLSRSTQTLDDLTDPADPARDPILHTHRFEGNKYYELTPAAVSASIVPNCRYTDRVLLGTSLRFNQGLFYGARYADRQFDVAAVQAPHTLSSTGTNAFAVFSDQDRLLATGAVITHDDVYSRTSTPSDPIISRYEQFCATTGDAIWVCETEGTAKQLLRFLEQHHEGITLPDVTLENYSRQQLQEYVVPDLNTPGLDTIWTVSQLHRELRNP